VLLDYLVFRVTLVVLVRLVIQDFPVIPVILALLVLLVLLVSPVLMAWQAKKVAMAVVAPQQVDRRPLRSARKLLV